MRFFFYEASVLGIRGTGLLGRDSLSRAAGKLAGVEWYQAPALPRLTVGTGNRSDAEDDQGLRPARCENQKEEQHALVR